MNYQENRDLLFFKLAQFCLVMTFTLISFNSFSQIPKRAISIADSVCQTRMLCANTNIQLEDSIFYPIFKNEYQDRKTESYFFTYKVYFKDDIETDLNISIKHDFSIKYISGFPDSSYKPSPCDILPIEVLWNKAKKKGLKTKFKKCSYSLFFDKNRITIKFHKNKSRWDMDYYGFDAVTGEYLGHQQMNVTF